MSWLATGWAWFRFLLTGAGLVLVIALLISVVHTVWSRAVEWARH